MTGTLVLATPLFLALAQTSVPGAASTPAAAPADYRVGAGDVLEVLVQGRDDLSRAPVVQTSGAVWLPVAGEIAVGGLTTAEIEARVADRLAGELANARVAVRVKEYQNQFVWVGGEVNRPGRRPLRGGTRLIDALVEAGGFTSNASGEVLVTRLEGTFQDGGRTLEARFARGAAPTPEEQASLELPLRNGDTIRAAAQHYVTVEGEIARPGRYVIEDETTLSGLVSSAGGLTRHGRSKVNVRRLDPRTGEPQLLEVDLRAIQEGKERDLVLLPNDAISVKRRVL